MFMFLNKKDEDTRLKEKYFIQELPKITKINLVLFLDMIFFF